MTTNPGGHDPRSQDDIVREIGEVVLRRERNSQTPRAVPASGWAVLGLSGKGRQVLVRILSGEEHQEPDNHRVGNGHGHRGRTEILG